MTNVEIDDVDRIVAYVMDEDNIPGIQIQKYYSLKWFLSALKKDNYTSQKPSTWADPAENFIPKL